jgi:hypothetical protein
MAWWTPRQRHRRRETAMNAQDVVRHLKEQPFIPFRIHLDDGRTFDIRHPEMMIVTKRIAVVAIPRPGSPNSIYDNVVTLSLLHIVTIEPIHTETKA